MKSSRLTSLAFTVVLMSAGATVAGAQQAPSAPSLPLGNASAVGDLLITPTRLVLEGRRRTAEVTLVNIGERTATYRITLTHLRMRDDGSIEEIEEPNVEDRIADSLIRYSPRQVILEPRVAQTVRIQVRKPADLEPGEYRSHLLFRGIPSPDDLGGSVDPAESSGLSVRLVPVYGVSIPLIVRHGDTAARATLRDVELVPGPDSATPFMVRGKLGREGNRSIYGNLRLTLTERGRERVIGMLNGVAVYPPLSERTIAIPIRAEDVANVESSQLKVTYLDAENDDAGGELLAEGLVQLR